MATGPDSGRLSARKHRSSPPSPPSRAADAVPPGGFALAGPSQRPDPATHAYRQDLADAALVGRVIASHYAEPLLRHIAEETALLSDRDNGGQVLAMLRPADPFEMLDCSLGWAWGYGGTDRQVGYVPAHSLKP